MKLGNVLLNVAREVLEESEVKVEITFHPDNSKKLRVTLVPKCAGKSK